MPIIPENDPNEAYDITVCDFGTPWVVPEPAALVINFSEMWSVLTSMRGACVEGYAHHRPHNGIYR